MGHQDGAHEGKIHEGTGTRGQKDVRSGGGSHARRGARPGREGLIPSPGRFGEVITGAMLVSAAALVGVMAGDGPAPGAAATVLEPQEAGFVAVLVAGGAMTAGLAARRWRTPTGAADRGGQRRASGWSPVSR